MNHPVLIVLLTAAGLYVGALWRSDLRAAQAGTPNLNAFPGAQPATRRAITLAATGALVLVALETSGEYALGISAGQSRMTWLFALYSMTAAPVIEELVFRGWLVLDVKRRSRFAPLPTWAAAVAASVLFAALHPFLWSWDEAGFALTLTTKGWFSFAAAFATSLWLYASRLAAWNPSHSLLPCFVAHAAKNFAVVAVKFATGFMGG
ncbi:MAG: CPBP family intramembrane glutamic endopeptidase, partial [Opitutus sp.]